tara:strand:- start:4116 stop:4793 length:678 start_codon:yes stop_codon:yes gene_type:complete
MARKIQIDLVDAIGTFMAKTNLLSNYLGDLDDLDSIAFAGADSNLVSAINSLSSSFDSINTKLFGSPPGTLLVTGFDGDSASLKRLRVGTLTADSATIDSATIDYLDVTGTMTADSARFATINVDSIGVDPGATLVIDSAIINTALVTSLTIDSARINRLTVGMADIDSAQIDSATITELTVNKLIIDSDRYELDNAKRFTVKDESGTIVLDGYFLSTSNDPTVA